MNLTVTLDTPATWQDVNETWDSPSARLGRPWGIFGGVLLEAQVFESLGIKDTYIDNINFIVRAMESLSLSETCSKAQALNLKIALTLIESGFKKASTSVINEDVTLAPATTSESDFHRDLREFLTLSDKSQKVVSLKKTELASISESKAFNVSRKIIESLGLVDAMSRVTIFHQLLSENIGVDDALSKAITAANFSSINLSEEFIRNAATVVTDLILDDKELDEGVFLQVMQRSSPVGFTEYQEFIEGEYSYKDALVKIVMSSTSDARAVLTDLKFHVDVPDVTESGSVLVVPTVGGQRVDFTRSFAIPPEVSLTLKGGKIVALPDVISTDQLGFNLILKDLSGVSVGGTVGWSAQGY